MRFETLLPFVVAGSAFVLPSEEVLGQLHVEPEQTPDVWYETDVPDLSSVKNSFAEFKDYSKSIWNHVSETSSGFIDDTFEQIDEVQGKISETIQDSSFWDLEDCVEDDGGHHGRHGRRPHHPPHKEPKEPEKSIWELISNSNYTTKLAKLVGEYDDLVDALNSTSANFTLFAPIDAAFEKIPDHGKKPSKETIKKILSYHVVPDVYSAGRVLVTHTVPTLFKNEHLGTQAHPQRLTFKLGLRGLTVNYYSRVIGANRFATNGVIHAVDSILVPPPSALTIINLFPGTFSTLELGLEKTGLADKSNSGKPQGGTAFAPTNNAFQRLGPRANAFLFSSYGQKYLKALLEYHFVTGHTLYSDAYYKPESKSVEGEDIPKGFFHVDLPTLLKGRSLSIDVARYGGFITIKINGFGRVAVSDTPADDGVIHVLSNVLIPPKNLGGMEFEQWDGTSELSVEDLKERLAPFVFKNDL